MKLSFYGKCYSFFLLGFSTVLQGSWKNCRVQRKTPGLKYRLDEISDLQRRRTKLIGTKLSVPKTELKRNRRRCETIRSAESLELQDRRGRRTRFVLDRPRYGNPWWKSPTYKTGVRVPPVVNRIIEEGLRTAWRLWPYFVYRFFETRRTVLLL